jgi:hypothetical protein
MDSVVVGAAIVLAAVAGPTSTPPVQAGDQSVTYEVAFVPLPSSERRYAALGPVGPFYPQNAVRQKGGGVGVTTGEAILECHTGAAGGLDHCKIISEAPTGFDFGVAARVMADRRRIIVENGPPEGEAIRVRVPFTPDVRAKVAP